MVVGTYSIVNCNLTATARLAVTLYEVVTYGIIVVIPLATT